MTGTLYYHATMANAYVYQDQDGALWQIPMTVGGWQQRQPYHGYRASLREMGPKQQRLLAKTAGIPEPA